jgi:hypothetical protein
MAGGERGKGVFQRKLLSISLPILQAVLGSNAGWTQSPFLSFFAHIQHSAQYHTSEER